MEVENGDSYPPGENRHVFEASTHPTPAHSLALSHEDVVNVKVDDDVVPMGHKKGLSIK